RSRASVTRSRAARLYPLPLHDALPIFQVGYGLEDRRVIAEIKDRGIRAKLSVLIPVFKTDWRERLDTAADPGADIFLMLYRASRSEDHTSELHSPTNRVCRPLLDKKHT